MSPIRLDLTARLAADLGLFAAADLTVASAEPAADELLQQVHDGAYVAAVRAASADPARADGSWGLGTDDVPAFRGMHEAAARIVQGTVDCAEAVWQGRARHAVNFCGGMHHAMAAQASGFCVYNDIGVAISWLLERGARVAYVDVDVHHGDGVEALFADDPRVLTISLHESGASLFPGTGFATETGLPSAAGTAVNVALPAGTTDDLWLQAGRAVIGPLVRAFQPDIVVSQHGCDTHVRDPLAHFEVTLAGQIAMQNLVHDLAHEVCEGKWVATGGGGYDVVHVVPRSWAHLLAVAAHRPVPTTAPVPQAWQDHVAVTLGVAGPHLMGDPAAAPPTAEVVELVNQAIADTRRELVECGGWRPDGGAADSEGSLRR
jgi:acetoin utilization protein AcuC